MNDDDGNGLYGGSVVTLTLEALDLIMIVLIKLPLSPNYSYCRVVYCFFGSVLGKTQVLLQNIIKYNRLFYIIQKNT